MPQTTPAWHAKVTDKRRRLRAAIPKEWIIPDDQLPSADVLNVMSFPERLLTEQELEITNLVKVEESKGFDGVHALLQKMKEGTWSAVEVTSAYAKRAVIAHQLVNCLTEIFIDDALEQARKLDDHLKRTGTVVGPLHGLPVSLKDQINVKGIESSMGYVSWIGEFEDKNAVLVDILLSLGAVPFVKTNVPQTLMWNETFNHVFGRTVNPYNRSLTSGGSSGGEGALVAMGGSPLGIGSDIGGSIRTPSAFCGIYGLRPSYNRIPYANCRNSLEGQDSAPSVLGPMTPGISVIKLFMQGVIGQKPWLKDPLVVRKPWIEDEYRLSEHGYGKQLCFAVLWHDEVIMPHPPITRGLLEVKEALLAAGHKVVDWKPKRHYELWKVLADIWAAGSAEDYETVCAVAKEPILSSMTVEEELRSVNEEISKPPGETQISAYQLWQLHKKKRDLRQEYLDWWEASEEWAQTGTGRPVDAIISPVAPYAAAPHGEHNRASYVMAWNTLDYPALVVPVSTVDPIKDAKSKQIAHEFFNEFDRANYESYDPQVFKDAPISIQVVGRTLEEEAVIGMAEIVDRALRNHKA